jgi:hypothetical protein
VRLSGDPDVADALILHGRPAWTWRALHETPARVVDALRLIDAEVARRG